MFSPMTRSEPQVAVAAGHPVKTLRIDGDDPHVQAFGQLAQVLRARIGAFGVDVDLAHRLGPLAEPAGDRVEPGECLHLGFFGFAFSRVLPRRPTFFMSSLPRYCERPQP